MTFMIPVGFAFACGIFVGNSLGEGKSRVAMQYYNASLVFAVIVTFIQILVLYFGMDLVIGLFTNQEPIAAIMRYAWPWLLVYTFFDTLQIMGSTVVRCTMN